MSVLDIGIGNEHKFSSSDIPALLTRALKSRIPRAGRTGSFLRYA